MSSSASEASPKSANETSGSIVMASVSTVADGIVDVAAFSDVLATLNPTTAQGSGPSHHTIALSNRGTEAGCPCSMAVIVWSSSAMSWVPGTPRVANSGW